MIKNLIFDFGKVLVDYSFDRIVDTFFKDKNELKTFRLPTLLRKRNNNIPNGRHNYRPSTTGIWIL